MKVVQLKYLSWWAYLLPIGLGLGVFSATVGLKTLFPSNVGWVSDGFIGVDIFFVISGFFISAILLKHF